MYTSSRQRCIEPGSSCEPFVLLCFTLVLTSYQRSTEQTKDGTVVSTPGEQNSEVIVTCPADNATLICSATVTEDGTYYMRGKYLIYTLCVGTLADADVLLLAFRN